MKKCRILLIVAISVMLILSITLAGCAIKNGEISGVVTTVTGEGVENAVVAIGKTSVTTDADGAFSIKTSIKDGSLNISKDGFASKTVPFFKMEFQEKKLACDVLLMQIGTVYGTIYNKDGTTPLDNVNIKIGSENFTTDSEGKYSAEVYVGTLNYNASKEGFMSKKNTLYPIDFNSDGTLNIDLTLTDVPYVPLSYSGIIRTLSSDIYEYTSHDDNKITEKFLTGGTVVTHTEGICLHCSSESDTLQSYIYGKLKISEDNDQMTISVRYFVNQGTIATMFVCVIQSNGDKTYITPNDNVKAGLVVNSEAFLTPVYDLSAYDGQTVALVIGTNVGNHCCINRISFE